MRTSIESTRRLDLVDSYPLSSLQQGMLFHCLDAENPGVYVSQIICTLDEDIDVSALQRAWQRVFQRHAIFRTSFCWDGNQEPIQEIHRQCDVPFEVEDWSNLSSADQERRSLELLASDRRRGIDLSIAPITRLKLVRNAEYQYKLLWTYHHILLDGRSTSVIMDEVFQFYQAFRDRRELELAEPRPYREYIDWAGRQDFRRHEFYWRKKMKGFHNPTEIPLPPMVNRERDIDQRFATQGLCLPLDLTSRASAFAKEHGLTLNTMIQCAWSLLLHRYSGDNDIVFGATRACRYSSVEGGESMVGLFLNTLPMRVQLKGETQLMDVLEGLRRQQVELRDYEQTPLHLVQKWSEVEHAKPLFESIVVFESAAADSRLRSKGGEWMKRRFYHKGQPHYPIAFNVCADRQLLLRIEYDRWRFADNSILRMLDHLKNLLAEIMANPQHSVAETCLLTDAEKHQLMTQWNDTVEPCSIQFAVHELFEAQARRTPDAIAVEFNCRKVTYRELNARANQLARYLRRLGLGPGKLAGVCIERSVEMIEALLGVLKAGGGYVPLDPMYPRERLAYMLEDAKVAVLLTEDQWRGKLTPASASQSQVAPVKIVCIDKDCSQIDSENTQNLPEKCDPDGLAYVIYTSGSTGTPKGVEIRHRSLVNLLNSMRDDLPFTERETLLAVTTISFDIAGLELYLPLIVGSKILLASRRDVSDGSRLVTLLAQHPVTAMQATPSTWRLLLEAGWQGTDRFKILCGGESFPADLVKPLLARGTVWNLYGPTETTIWSSANRLAPGDNSISIGRPIANTQMYILDAYLQPTPIGIPGELYIGGAGLARGYLHRPELTAEKFIRNPFSDDPWARLYKTGDLARYLPNGNVEFVGRVDNQVKVRGFRIELGEIESILARHPGVRRAVVLAREDNPGDKRLVAYIVPRSKVDLSNKEMGRYLRDQLPEYMVPSAFVMLDDFPLTPNGKIDRKALHVAGQKRREMIESYRSPRTSMEETLASIWAEVLGVEKVGINDNFFDLGGHSLLALRVVNLIRRRLGSTVRIASIFQAPTVEQMARALIDDETTAASSSLISLQTTLTTGSKPAFFWVHGDASNAYLYRYLDPGQRLYALQHQSTDGRPAVYRSVEDIASYYLKEICTAQPYGPYRLGGNCFGGLVAFEMAHQLQKRGETVDLLVLLNPASQRRAVSKAGYLANWTLPNDLHHLQVLLSFRLNSYWHALKSGKSRIRSPMRRLSRFVKKTLQKAVCTICERMGFAIPVSLRSRYILEIYFRALELYVARPIQGNIVLFLTHDFPRERRHHWSKQCTGVATIRDVPGDHTGVLEDQNVKVWAEKLAACLEPLEMAQPAIERPVRAIASR